MNTNQNVILVVDDNPENLRVLSNMLKQENYIVRVAQNGKQALASIVESEPDLVLLDVNMPEMNGLEVCKRVKSDPAYDNLPVIFISALDDSFNKSLGLAAGAIDYMTKPFDVDEVKVRVKTYLQLRYYKQKIQELEIDLKDKDQKIIELRNKLNK